MVSGLRHGPMHLKQEFVCGGLNIRVPIAGVRKQMCSAVGQKPEFVCNEHLRGSAREVGGKFAGSAQEVPKFWCDRAEILVENCAEIVVLCFKLS